MEVPRSDNITPMIPDALRPRPIDFLMAAANLHAQGRLQPVADQPKGTYPLTVGKVQDLVYRTREVKRGKPRDVDVSEDQLIKE